MTNVILMCPRCKTRIQVPYPEWVESCLPRGEKMRCGNQLCDKNVMLYHKDA